MPLRLSLALNSGKAGFSAAAAVAGLAITLLSSVSAQSSPIPLWQPYDEYSFLNGWVAETFPNFPLDWWTSGPACQDGTHPGLPGIFPGIFCSLTPSTGANQVTDIDLSPASLPPGSTELFGQLQSPPFLVGLRFLSSLNLGGSRLSGSIPGSLELATSLRRLVLANNNLSGTVPQSLCSLGLSCLNIANNSLSGRIPQCLQHFPCVDFSGNKFSRQPGDCNESLPFSSCSYQVVVVQAPPSPALPPSPATLSAGAVAGIVVGLLAAAAAAVALLVVWKRRVERIKDEEERRRITEQLEAELSSASLTSLRRFTFAEVSLACDEFSSDRCIGKGGYSVVYKGQLDNGQVVAIKRVHTGRAGSQRELQFARELQFISKARHRNLVPCVGFCVLPGECLCLLMPFCPNGSVASRTRGKQGSILSWESRKKVARGAANGLAYLHNDCSPPILHGDIKAENVLLGQNDEPLLSDFGLARQEQDGETLASGVRGTLGHIAPESFYKGEYSRKSDVYAFGVFLLELISGISITDITANSNAVEKEVESWLPRVLKEEAFHHLIDSEIQPPPSEVKDLLGVALACMASSPDHRPTTNEVTEMLDKEWVDLAMEIGSRVSENFSMAPHNLLGDLTKPDVWENATTGGLLPLIEEARKKMTTR